MQIDILIYAAIAVVLIIWMVRITGTKHGNERQRQNPFVKGGPLSPEVFNAQKIVVKPVAVKTSIGPDITNRPVETALVQIAMGDPNFDSRRFVEQAKDAFLFVVGAFGRGDRDTLRDLLAPNIYSHFATELDTREANKQTLTTEVQAFRGAEIIDAALNGSQASVTVKFSVAEIYALRDATGALLQGNPDKPMELVDVWTFGRDIAKPDPRWFVMATRPDTSAASERAG